MKYASDITVKEFDIWAIVRGMFTCLLWMAGWTAFLLFLSIVCIVAS